MCATNCLGLDHLVNDLVKITEIGDSGRYKRIKHLKEICEMFLNEYVIKIGKLTIEPLLVEAYYYHEGRFEDTSVHAAKDSKAPTYQLARERQKNNFGKLYVHYGTKDGIDIVLSLGDGYYLSLLIKNALVNGEWATQCAISEKICGKCYKRSECKGQDCLHYGEIVLEPVENKKQEIVFFPRKGVKGDFAMEPLAALPIDRIKDYPFTTGISRSEIVKAYIREKYMRTYLHTKNPEERAKEEKRLKTLAHGLIAWKTCIGE